MHRRDFLALTMSSVGALVAGTSASVSAAVGPTADPQRNNTPRGGVLETVTGPIDSSVVTWALAHEHMHGDFTGSKPTLWEALPEGYELPDYADLDWSAATGACINAVNELAAQGVNLIVDYSPAGVGRNARMLRQIARATGVHIICASGLYRTAWGIPPALQNYDSDELARHFVRELTLGVEGTSIRAGFMKLSVADDGPLPHDEIVYRGAARAAIETGAAIGMHARTGLGITAALKILEDEKLDFRRFIWAHALRDGSKDYALLKAVADRGAYISFDGVAYNAVPSDEEILGFVERLYSDGYGDRVLLSTDSVITSHPPVAQYDRHIRYLYRYFKPKLEVRFGEEVSKQILRDNVIAAYGRGHRVT